MIRTSSAAVGAALSSFLLVATADVAAAAQIKILAGSAIETAMAVLIPQFEQSSRHKVAFDFNGAIGAMADRCRPMLGLKRTNSVIPNVLCFANPTPLPCVSLTQHDA